MALETGTYISDLNSANPVATDGLAQADDHLRLVKSTIKATLPNLTGAVTSTHTELNALDGYTGNTADLNILSGTAAAGVTSTELGYLDGATSAIQTQINSKQATVTGAATTIVSSNLTASRALVSDTSGKAAVSNVTSTELGYLDGVTSLLQTQLDNKASSYTQATSTWETGAGTTESIVSPAKIAAAIYSVVSDYALGVGQTWQNMSGSRSLNQVYQNTTGRPISVVVVAGPAGNSTLVFQISSNANMTSHIQLEGQHDNDGATTVGNIVPAGQYYRAYLPSGAFYRWSELR